MATLIGRVGPRRATPLSLLSRVSRAIRRVGRRIVENYEVTRTRRILMTLDERTLRDLGLSRADLERLED